MIALTKEQLNDLQTKHPKIMQNLKDFIVMNFEIKELFTDEQIKEQIKENFQPDDLYDDDELQDWAYSSGYVREKE